MRYTYDDSGRLVESQAESEWTGLERSIMLALDEYRTEITCSVCGLPKSVCRDSKNEGKFDAGFERCFASTAVMKEQDAVGGENGVAFPQSLAWDVSLKR